MRLLLDTVVLIYAVESPERLSRRAAAALQNPANILEFSAVSVTEMAIKNALGKLNISAAITKQALDDLGIRVLPHTGEQALHLFDLPLHHADLFDRQIIAQALFEKIAVVTPDEEFRLYKGLR
ncbi:MAG: type II toxin-antitoxin system VapC family toxin, partial [Candidatus Sulfotelmatobacter sp.]